MPVPLACGALTNKARLASLQFVLLLMSPAYLQSKACIREMVRACAELSEPSRILPIVIEKYDLETAFGSSGYHTGMLNATIGNILPPPDQGVFEDDFDGNMIKLIERIRSVGLSGTPLRGARPTLRTWFVTTPDCRTLPAAPPSMLSTAANAVASIDVPTC